MSALFTKQKTTFKQRLLSLITSLSQKSRILKKEIKRKFLSIKKRLLRWANILKIVQNVPTRFSVKQFELKYN